MTRTYAPRDTTSRQVARDQRPASPDQRRLVADLLAERDTTGTVYQGWAPDWSKPTATVKATSTVITHLMTLPRKAQAAPQPTTRFGANWSTIPVGGAGFGYYALQDGEDRIRFFRVERPKSGKHAGKTFIKEQAGDAFYSVEPRSRGFAYMTAIASDPEAAGRLYAQTLDKCTRCGRTLTDEDSRARSMGPDCASKTRGW